MIAESFIDVTFVVLETLGEAWLQQRNSACLIGFTAGYCGRLLNLLIRCGKDYNIALTPDLKFRLENDYSGT